MVSSDAKPGYETGLFQGKGSFHAVNLSSEPRRIRRFSGRLHLLAYSVSLASTEQLVKFRHTPIHRLRQIFLSDTP